MFVTNISGICYSRMKPFSLKIGKVCSISDQVLHANARIDETEENFFDVSFLAL